MLSLIAALGMATATIPLPIDEFCMMDYSGMKPVRICESVATATACVATTENGFGNGYIRFSTPIYGDVQYFPVTNFRQEGFAIVADNAWDFGDLIFKQGDADWDSCEPL